MKAELTSINSMIDKYEDRSNSFLFSRYPLLRVLVDAHKDYLRNQEPLLRYCKPITRESGSWFVSARHADNAVEWSLYRDNGKRACRYTGEVPKHSKRSVSRRLGSNASKPLLPIKDRIQASKHANSKARRNARSLRKPAIVSRPQLPKKDQQRENGLKLLAASIAAACHARVYQ